MTKENVYLITYKRENPKKGKVAKVIGMKKITTKTEVDDRTEVITYLCYEVIYEDGTTTLINADTLVQEQYHFVTIEDLLKVGMPKP